MFAYWLFKRSRPRSPDLLWWCKQMFFFFQVLFECFGGGEAPTSQHWNTVFIHIAWKVAQFCSFGQMFQLCSWIFYYRWHTDLLTSPADNNPSTQASAIVVCACLCVCVSKCAFFFCCTLGLMRVIGVLLLWIGASPGGGQIAYDDHVLTRWLAGTTFRTGGVCVCIRVYVPKRVKWVWRAISSLLSFWK